MRTNNIRKILSAATALSLSMAMSVPAFAAEIKQDTTDKTGSTTVGYTVEQMYIVTIPGSVTIDGADVEVKAEGVKVPYGQKVVVKLTSTSGENNAFTVAADGATLSYVVTKGGTTQVTVGGEVLSVNPADATDNTGASGKETLSFDLPANTNVLYAGNYTGTVTFTVSVE